MGDLDAPEVDALVLRYLGTIAPRPPASPPVARPIQVVYPPAEQRRQAWHLKVRRAGLLHVRGAGRLPLSSGRRGTFHTMHTVSTYCALPAA